MDPNGTISGATVDGGNRGWAASVHGGGRRVFRSPESQESKICKNDNEEKEESDASVLEFEGSGDREREWNFLSSGGFFLLFIFTFIISKTSYFYFNICNFHVLKIE